MIYVTRRTCLAGNIAYRARFVYSGRMTGLRERKKADTRRALSDAALKLAFERVAMQIDDTRKYEQVTGIDPE